MVLMCVTCFDVICRKLGLPIPFTIFQELEWHLHTAIFSLWMGYNYTINAHPRVDSFTERLQFRAKAWVELAGCAVFALPFMAMLAYYGWDFVKTAWDLNEDSDSAIGIPHRWVIKGVLYLGLWLVLLGVVSVMIRLVLFLFCGRPREEVDLRIGHSASEV